LANKLNQPAGWNLKNLPQRNRRLYRTKPQKASLVLGLAEPVVPGSLLIFLQVHHSYHKSLAIRVFSISQKLVPGCNQCQNITTKANPRIDPTNSSILILSFISFSFHSEWSIFHFSMIKKNQFSGKSWNDLFFQKNKKRRTPHLYFLI